MFQSLLPAFFLLLVGEVLANGRQYVPNRYIVEVDESHAIFHRDVSPADIHKRVYNHFEARGVEYETHHEYDSPGVFVGMSVTVNDQSHVHKLHTIPGVRAIRPVRRFSIPRSPRSHPLGKREQLDLLDMKKESVFDTLHAATGVDKLHALGFRGKGIKVAIIDTGVDWSHPVLGNGLGPGHKIFTGHDYVSKPPGPSDKRPKQDNDPMDCDGHGTHVSGIVAGIPGVGPFNITGVAPEAELSAYKVADCFGGNMDDDIIIAAMLQADKDENHIMNLSLGGQSGWTEEGWSVAASRLAEKGRIMMIAAGNEGSDGPWYASGPATGEEVISVASVDTPTTPLQSLKVGGDEDHEPIPYYTIFPLLNKTDKAFPVYVLTEKTKFGCKELPDSVPDLKDYVVATFLDEEKCDLETLKENLVAKGAKAAVVWRSEFGSVDNPKDFALAAIPKEHGEWLEKQFLSKKKITVTVPKGGQLIHYAFPSSGYVSSFSTYGPSFDMKFMPSLAAFGSELLSTFPVAKGSYQLMGGTSMATPYLAGCAALLLEARGATTEVARQARNFFEATANYVPINHTHTEMLNTAAMQGAGLVDAYAAALTQSYVWPGELPLNDTTHFKGIQNFTVKNLGDKKQTYSVKHIPAATAFTIQQGTYQPETGPWIPLIDAPATVDLSTTTFTLEPKQTQVITAKFTEPKGLDAKRLPVYSGYIEVESDSDRMHVSYMGVVGSLFKQQVLDTSDYWLANLTLPAIVKGQDEAGQYVAQKKETTYKLGKSDEYPRLIYRYAFGTAKLDIDLVDPSFELDDLSSKKVPIIGNFYNDTYLYRHSTSTDEYYGYESVLLNNSAAFSDGSYVPDGTYKILIRALRVTGDPKNPDDYDSWLSPAFTVEYNEESRKELDAAKVQTAVSDSETVQQPFFKRPWFIAIVVVAAVAAVAAVVALVFVSRRKRQSNVRFEEAFVPPMGAYTPLKDESQAKPSYSNTEYKPDGRYS